ncbi:MAG TPA: tetratricopeptide repeat protein [Candidatus Binatus sp.]|uniref:tetratricopeptide repeat protein n=1 Tax=Candidatus Binatus sp. TaxID=2811406 RepID=UPI002B4A7D68|nr:tetratricopeptide repeat protein [Candidatus Binatus sp.]HKN13251.1 tetratricopeptide repeat protein [Candidatus Binatus sp.]
MRFCPQCGAPLLAGAKFCVECGRALDVAASGAGESGSARGGPNAGRNTITTAFVFVFVALAVVGLAAAAWIYVKTPEVVREQIAVAPPPVASPPSAGAPASSPGAVAPSQPAPEQNVAANPAAGGTQNGGLPPGHPTIELPTEARSFVDKIERDAIAKPKDVTAWNKFGAVSMRAAMFDQSYYGKAEEAYGHVLKLQPDNLDALRGIGDIDYDKQLYDQAIAAYEHYLKKKPDDPEVRTDLGTMYLYTGNADQAVVQYKKVIAANPGFFQARLNLGIAYAQENNAEDAVATLKQAQALAPDDTSRAQVKDLLAKLTGAPAASAAAPPSPGAQQSAAASTPGSSATAAPQASASPASSPAAGKKDFHGAVEDMVRGLPIAGPKVSSVQWPAKFKAKVLMDSFPMDQMPAKAKESFLAELKLKIGKAKKDHHVSSQVQVDFVDGASGRVMETVTR